MAQLRPHGKALFIFMLPCILLLIQKSNAFEFRVGGSQGSWIVPTDSRAEIYNKWAENNRFQIGDTLLFVYVPGQDSVLHVTKDDYTTCNTSAPLERFTDGHTTFKFNQSGPYYFISGVAENCHKNEKMVVVVMANRSKGPSHSPSPSPSAPSPAPVGGESYMPFGMDMNPSMSPFQESNPPSNGVALIYVGVIGTIATSIGSWIVMAI